MNILALKRQLFPMSGPQMDGGGGSSSSGGTQIQELPEWARPYAKNALEKGAALSETPYQKYDQPRIAGFSPLQQQSQQAAANMQTSGATGAGINAAGLATLGALGTDYQGSGYGNQFQAPDAYQTGQFRANNVRNQRLNQYQMEGPQDVQSRGYNAASMQGAQTGFDPLLQNYQMGPAERVSAQNFGGQSAQDYMSPYMQNVVDVQQREAQRQADIAGTQRGAQAARTGAFGGSRQAVMEAEAARNLATQKGDIQAQGLQGAYQQAQQQFNADQARQMAAQQANQGAGLTTGAQNLAANLGVQQLGTQTGLQTSLANLSNEQQAAVQNQAAQNQAMGMSSQQALQAALANQQAGLTTGQQNLAAKLGVQQLGAGQDLQAQLANQQYGLQAQQLGEQSRQFGAGQGLQAASLGAQYGQAANQLNEQSRQYGAGLGMQGLQTALTGANTLGSLGGQQFQQGMDINKLQNAYGGQQQALRQQGLSQAYSDFQDEKNYPYKQLGFMSDMIRGLPLGQQTTKTMYEPNPGMAQQVGALGMGAYGLSKFMADGGMAYADGGEVEGYDEGGSVDSADNVGRIVSKLSDQQLQQAMQAAQARGDQDQLEAIQSEMAMRASERNGIASAVTPQMANQMAAAGGGLMDSYAGGGVVAFARGGLQDDMARIRELGEENIAPTAEERMSGIRGALPGIQSLYGDSALKPFLEDLKKDREGLGKQKNMGEGLAYLAGADALLRPGSKSRAVTGAFAAIGGGLAKAEKDFTDANSKLRQSEMTLAASEQARKDGQIGKAESLYEKGVTDKKEAIARELGAREKAATIQASVDNSIRSANAQLASVNKPGETERMLSELDAIRTGKKAFQGLTGEEGAKAYQDSVGQLGAARYGVKYTGQNKEFEHRKAVLEVLQKDEGVKIAQMKVANLEAKEKLTEKDRAALDASTAFLKKRYEAVSSELQKSGAPAGGADGVQTGAPSLQKFMAAARNAPENKGVSDDELRAYYQRTYGR
jgi:hypothetical protein